MTNDLVNLGATAGGATLALGFAHLRSL